MATLNRDAIIFQNIVMPLRNFSCIGPGRRHIQNESQKPVQVVVCDFPLLSERIYLTEMTVLGMTKVYAASSRSTSFTWTLTLAWDGLLEWTVYD